jgi:hypothetical protein
VLLEGGKKVNHFKEHGAYIKAIIYNFEGCGWMRLVATAKPEPGDIVLTRKDGDTFKCESCGELVTLPDDASLDSVGKAHAKTHVTS